jgi:hypothetical protein
MKATLFALAFILCSAAIARAHKASDSYLTLRSDGAQLAARWDIALRDLDQAIGLDRDGDGAITWGEVRAREAAIDAYALARMHVAADGTACTARAPEHLIDRHSDGTYAVLRFTLDCAAAPRLLDVDYRLFFDFDPQHRGVLRIVSIGEARTLLFSADQIAQHIDLAGASSWQTVADFWRDGVWHICAGLGHVLFLLALLMPAVLRRESGRWHAVGLEHAFGSTLKVVTAFTVAHSLTLSLAALGTVTLPARVVASGIAASVIVAALNNAYPFLADGRWLIAFGFGLVHGFGLGGALADGVPHGALMPALLGFNIGVESGQAMIVGALFAFAYLLRRPWREVRRRRRGGAAGLRSPADVAAVRVGVGEDVFLATRPLRQAQIRIAGALEL